MKAVLNQVLPRLYSMGIYRDLTIQYQLPIVDGCITLPKNAESVLMFQLNKTPSKVRSLWHDFKAAGMTGGVDPMLWGLVDAGYHATQVLMPEPEIDFEVVRSAYDTNKSPINHKHFTIEMIATNGEEMFSAQSVLNVSEINLGFPEAVTSIESIRFTPSTVGRIYDIVGVQNPDVVLATVGPHAEVTRYRRYRIPSTSETTTAHVLVKRAFEPIVDDHDIVYISNLAAIKHGLLAVVAEDNADLERANYHWTECQKNMELDMESARGAAIPSVAFDIMGMEGRNALQQML